MTYKRKLAVLSAIIVVLSAIYILSLVLDRDNRRSDAFAWLDSSLIVMADRIEITGQSGEVSLSRNNNVWVLSLGTRELPVRQSRVEDFFALLSRRDIYPLRAVTSEARERLRLTEERASRILVRGGAGLPLLDLLVGEQDVMGKEAYLRKSGGDQIYSGELLFSVFANSLPILWYDLRLFEDLSIDAVQQTDISLPDGEAYTLRRSGGGWILLENESAPLEVTRVEAWIRSVIEAQGEEFPLVAPEDFEGTLTLWLGDGTSRTLQAGPPDAGMRRNAVVSSSPMVYTLPEHTFNRLFRESSYFVRD